MRKLDPEQQAILQTKLDMIAKAIRVPPRSTSGIQSSHGRLTGPTVPCPDCDGYGGEDLNPSKAKYDDGHGETYYGDWQDCETCNGTGEIEVAHEMVL